ncbi:DUF6493 family protein [Micromonospora sp. NBC_01813]|uniref:DUF6493 family protein n=1 Tax=Micromonospora sp. NBC_01813 TaxID=2975988 RepID=UPI002DDBEB9B|nr:DUF6493 family protein [Micromonospora sp. NBC_01813]WSA10935.1 DUF6493 family protein [Micromonospora sp. NBC_01813]
MTDPLDFLHTGDIAAATATVDGLDETQRRQLGADLVAHVRRRHDEWWSSWQATALAVAAVGCLPTAAQAAEILGRRNVSLRQVPATPVIEVARRRGVTWLADLAYRLAARADRSSPGDSWRFVADLLHAEQAPPPAEDRFVIGWAAIVGRPTEDERREVLADRLRQDPWLDSLAPRLFEVDGLGDEWTWARLLPDNEIGQDGKDRPLKLPAALAQLAADGRLDRSMLLDGTLSRLLRGERPAALRVFIALHDELAPTVDEVGDRRAAYLRLLADGASTVVALAQRMLRRLPEIDLAALLDTSSAVLLRPEKTLVRAQLSWLDQLARRDGTQAARVAEVLAVAAEHPAVDIADRARALAAMHGHRAVGPAEVRLVGDTLPPVATPAAVPPPIAHPDELAEEVAALFATEPTDALALERVLAGVLRLACADRAAVAAALGPVLNRAHRIVWPSLRETRFGGLTVVLRVVVGAHEPIVLGTDEPVSARGWSSLVADWGREPKVGQRPADPRHELRHRLLRTRVAEIGQFVTGRGAAQRVAAPTLAAPTFVTGAVASEALFDRLARLGEQPPWPADFAQALLRLPAVVDEPLAAKAAALGTPAGQTLAAWLRDGGLPRPHCQVVTVTRRDRHNSHDYQHDRLPARRRLVELAAPRGARDPYGLLDAAARPVDIRFTTDEQFWPTQLPGYRGLVAAYTLPLVASCADQDEQGHAMLLPMLAERTGESGPALDLAVAYGLAARHEADRVATVDALLALAADGGLDATAVGTHLGSLAADGMIVLSRVAAPLRDATAAGAPLTVWRILAAALPALLTCQPPPRGLPDLLALAAQNAAVTGARIEVPGLADVAGRGGSSRLVAEARRLVGALGSSSGGSAG